MTADNGPVVKVSESDGLGGTMQCSQCRNVFQAIGDCFNKQAEVKETLEAAAQALVGEFNLKACHFRLLSRDLRILEDVASYGLSEKFLAKGPVDAEKSVAEALEGHVVMIDDCASDPRIQYPTEFAEEGIVSLLTIPLETRGQVIGVMRLSTPERRVFTVDELAFFSVAALFCTSAVVHAMFHQILEHVTDTIRSSLDLEEVLNSIAKVVVEDLRSKGCTIRLLDSSGESLDLCAAYGLSARYLEKASADPGQGVWKAMEGRCVSILDARTDDRVRHHEEVIHEKIGSMLFVPLMIRNKAIGVLSVYTHRQYQFSEDEIELMEAIGGQCALAIRNAQMYAAIKRRYDSVVDEFHQWFEHYYTYPTHTPQGR
jgi:GAF domain-containing protein